jgi:hypothetical protein
MRVMLLVTLVLLLSTADAVPADAQVIAPPPRSATAADAQPANPRAGANQRTRNPRATVGIFGGRRSSTGDDRQELSTTINVLGSYDTSLGAQGEVTAFSQSGTTGTVATDVSYQLLRGLDSITGSASGFLNTYQGVDVEPMVGGTGDLRAVKGLGEHTRLNGGVSLSYRPTFTFNGAAVAPGESLGPGTDPATGILEMQSLSTSGQAGLSHEWNRGHRTTATVTHSRQHHTATDLDVRTTGLALGQRVSLTRTVGLQLGYGFNEQATTDRVGTRRPQESHYASFGGEYRLQVSRSRLVTFSGGPAIVRVSAISSITDLPFEYYSPSGYATVRMDLARTWSVAANFNRQSTMLEGLTPQSFLTSSLSLSAGGGVTSRAEVAVSASYSEGAPHEGDQGSFSGASGTVQLQYNLARWGGLVTNYSYYRHELRDITSLPAGFPSLFDRHSFRVGMTVWLPLFGSFTSGQTRTAAN